MDISINNSLNSTVAIICGGGGVGFYTAFNNISVISQRPVLSARGKTIILIINMQMGLHGGPIPIAH